MSGMSKLERARFNRVVAESRGFALQRRPWVSRTIRGLSHAGVASWGYDKIGVKYDISRNKIRNLLILGWSCPVCRTEM